MKRTHFIKGQEYEILFDEAAIQESVRNCAYALKKDYANKDPLFLVIANGAIFFAKDLLDTLGRHSFHPRIETIIASRYEGNNNGKEEFNIIHKDGLDFTGQDIVIVEDLIDYGKTLNGVYESIKVKNPKSIKTAVLLVKEGHEYKYPIDYQVIPGLVKKEDWIVGYGMDDEGLLRELPFISKKIIS